PDERDWRYRFFEILPGALTWIILAVPVVLSWLSPKLAAYFIIVYLLLWFVRAIGINLRSVQGLKLVNEHKNAPWQQLNDELETLEPSSGSPKWHVRNVQRVAKYIPDHRRIKPNDVIHAVFIAFWNESRDVLEPTVQAVLDSNYDSKKIIL